MLIVILIFLIFVSDDGKDKESFLSSNPMNHYFSQYPIGYNLQNYIYPPRPASCTIITPSISEYCVHEHLKDFNNLIPSINKCAVPPSMSAQCPFR